MIELKDIIETTANMKAQIERRVGDPLHDVIHIEILLHLSEEMLSELHKLNTGIVDFKLSIAELRQMIDIMIRITKQDDYSPFQHMVLHIKGLLQAI